MKNPLFIYLLTITTALPIFANVSAPGIWGAGHGSVPTPLFGAEAAAIAQVQMRVERIRIDLYRNFAVVAGTYRFYNHGNTRHRIHAGYPVNGSVTATPPQEHIRFNDLYHLDVRVDGVPVPAHRLDRHPDISLLQMPTDIESGMREIGNWYVWTMDFPTKREVRVDVRFIVHTPASLTKGYGKREANAFAYILQTGSAWKDSIQDGKLLVTLRDGLKASDIRGIYPVGSCRYAGDQLVYAFRDLRPSAKDDLVIWYDGSPAEPGLLNADSLYRVADQVDTTLFTRTDLPVFDKQDFSTPTPDFVWVLLGGALIGLLLMAGIGFFIFKMIKFWTGKNR
jgi:hypothetical protein